VPPREYELAARLLAAAVDSDSGGMSRSVLLDAAREFGADVGARSRPRGNAKLGARPAVKAALRDYGYEPRTADDGSVELHNCPFHQLVASHQELVCGMNLALVQGLIAGMDAAGLPPRLDPKPGRCCVVIGPAQQAHDATAGGMA
jgi:predicted ArsR family transcriptional regulator